MRTWRALFPPPRFSIPYAARLGRFSAVLKFHIYDIITAGACIALPPLASVPGSEIRSRWFLSGSVEHLGYLVRRPGDILLRGLHPIHIAVLENFSCRGQRVFDGPHVFCREFVLAVIQGLFGPVDEIVEAVPDLDFFFALPVIRSSRPPRITRPRWKSTCSRARGRKGGGTSPPECLPGGLFSGVRMVVAENTVRPGCAIS